MARSLLDEREDLKELNNRLEAFVAANNALRETADKATLKLAKTQQTFSDEIAGVKKSFQAEVSTLAARVEALTNERQQLRDRVSTLESAVQAGKTAAAALEVAQKELATLKSQLAEARSTGDAMSRARTSLEAAVKERSADLSIAQKALAEAQSRVTVLSSDLRTATAELNVLRDSHNTLLTQVKESATAKVAEARATWEALQAKKLKELEVKMKREYESEVTLLRERTVTQADTATRLRADLTKTAAELSAAQEVAAATTKRLAELEARHKAEMSRWQEEKGRLESSLTAEVSARIRKEDEYARMAAANNSLASEIDHYSRILDMEEKRSGIATPPSRKKARREEGEGAGAGATATGFSGAGTSAGATTGTSDAVFRRILNAVSSAMPGSTEKAPASSSTSPVRSTTAAAAATAADGGAGTGLKPATASGRKRARPAEEIEVADEEEEGGSASASAPASASSHVGSHVGGVVTLELDLLAELVTVHNNSTRRVLDLTGYTLKSEKGDQRFSFPAGTKVKPGGQIQIASGASAPRKDTAACLAWTRRYVWNNSGDVAVLLDNKGKVVARCEEEAVLVTHGSRAHTSSSSGGAGAGHGSHGGSGGGSGAANHHGEDLRADNVVIANRTDEPVDMSGWSLVSESNPSQRFSFPSGVALEPGQAVTVWSGPDAHKKQQWPMDLVWAKSYVWKTDGDAALLMDPQNRVVSRVEGSARSLASPSFAANAASSPQAGAALDGAEAMAAAGGPAGNCIIM